MPLRGKIYIEKKTVSILGIIQNTYYTIWEHISLSLIIVGTCHQGKDSKTAVTALSSQLLGSLVKFTFCVMLTLNVFICLPHQALLGFVFESFNEAHPSCHSVCWQGGQEKTQITVLHETGADHSKTLQNHILQKGLTSNNKHEGIP